MDATPLLLYVVTVSAVMVSPGPSMLLALNNGACHGMRVAGFGIAGAGLEPVSAQRITLNYRRQRPFDMLST
ncbi:hypothetical protein [Achromobacter sp. 79A6]|jgi:threonine/homoserine/homoserine lactone efflux protein|uniref:hypothetical protein n=1 Tax=unclassified Achromobacter TaxID=2626865 RepID=UPI0021F0CA13